MAVTVVSVATGPGGQTGNTVVVSKPTGKWTDGNLLVLFTAADIPTSGTIGIPAAFTSLGADSDGETISGWRVCSSEPSSYTVPMASGSAGSRAAIIVELSGQDATTPINDNSVKSGNSKTASFTSLTTTVDGCLILAFVGDTYRASTTTFGTPTGFSPQGTDQSGVVSSFSTATEGWSFSQASAGAITPGNSTITNAATAANNFWGTAAIAVAPATVTAVTMTAAAGSFALTGIAALFRYFHLAVAAGAIALTGVAAKLERGLRLAASAGAFTETGVAAILKHGFKLVAAAASFTLAGVAAILKRGLRFAVSAGAITLTGIAATLSHAVIVTLAVAAAAFALTGNAVTFGIGRKWAKAADATGTWTKANLAAASWTKAAAATGTWTKQSVSAAAWTVKTVASAAWEKIS